MRRISYHLGENMHRRLQRRRMVRGLVVMALIVTAGLLGVQTIFVYQDSTTNQTELSHRSNKYRGRGHVRNLDNDGGSRWLRVERAQSVVPSATPSDDVRVQTSVPSPVKVNVDGKSVIVNQPVSTPVPVPPAAQQSDSEPAPVQPAPQVVVVPPQQLPQIEIPAGSAADLSSPAKKDVAMQLVSSAENSSLNWKDQYGYIEDIGDGRGYTGGIIGFTSGTHDMLELVRYYTKLSPSNPLAKYIPALEDVDGSDSHAGLGSGFEAAWKQAASDAVFQRAQNDERDRSYFNPAVSQAKSDELRALGQFIYYDAMVMHGPGSDAESFGGIRAAALKKAKSPAQGGDERTYLNAFLDARVAAMKQEAAHEDVSRVETAQRKFLEAGNFNLNTPLSWSVYGDPFKIQ